MVFFGLKEILCENIFLQKAVNCCIFICHVVMLAKKFVLLTELGKLWIKKLNTLAIK